jgi:hypothetical protein
MKLIQLIVGAADNYPNMPLLALDKGQQCSGIELDVHHHNPCQ